MDDLYYLPNSRSDKQTRDMQELEAAGKCIFCPEVIHSDPDQVVIHETPYWIVSVNEYPYAGTLHHWLLTPRQHVEDLADLPQIAFADMWSVLGWLRATYGLTFYGLASRNGDVALTSGTIRHVHVQVLVGDVDNPDHESIRFKLSKRREH